jgi:hypothetical protein
MKVAIFWDITLCIGGTYHLPVNWLLAQLILDLEDASDMFF